MRKEIGSMAKLKLSLLAVAASLAVLEAHSFLAQAFPEEHPGKSAGLAANALTIERISTEPDTDERTASLHWSPDGRRVAWMQLLRPPAKAMEVAPQQEIWTVSSQITSPELSTDANSPSHSQSIAATINRHAEQVLLVSAAKVTASLSGAGTPIHPKLDDDDTDSNPYLLRDFAWSPDHASLLLIGSQSLAWLDVASGASRILVPGGQSLADATLSPDGHTISFIRNHGLWLVDVKGGSARSFAPAIHRNVLEGESDWPYRNELHLPRAYWWSPDSSHIAYLETDDRAVARYTLRASNGESREIVYPKPGGSIPIARVFVKRLAGGIPFEINLGSTKDSYLPRVSWLPDGRHLAIERLDRFQHNLNLILADSVTGKTEPLLTEKDQYWVNLSDDLYFSKDGKHFLWSSERSGFRHLYLYDIQGKQLAQLTRGDWEVTCVNTVDESRGVVYFTATEKSPLERHLYRINLDGSGMTRITQLPGTHEALFAPNTARFVDSYSSQTTPPRLFLMNTDTSNSTEMGADSPTNPSPSSAVATDGQLSHHDTASPSAQSASAASTPFSGSPSKSQSDIRLSLALQPIDFIPLKLHLGAESDAFMIRPPDFDPAKKYPVIVYLAGGPGEQLVRDAWGGATSLWMQLMAQKGYVIFALDNHGTAGRGHFFEEPIHLRLGAQELTDQRDGLAYLGSLPYVDTARLGVCGWGYGGFLVIHAMLDRPVAFKAGFAGAPITDWHFYDSIFAERYLDNPVSHADGWDASTAFENDSSRFFKGSLMVAQGTEDEFVHMENTLTLQDRLLDAGKSADFLLFPDRGHLIVDRPSRLVLFNHMTDFFLKNL
jgi:dipeptidyl-peptidase 4